MDAQARRKPTVVIAEDEYLISLEVARAAREAGFEVAGVAGNGERAIELVRTLSPDAAILDIMMPGMTGLEAARRIREVSPVPVVVMTAYETPEFLAEAKEAGAGAYLVKPPSGPALRRALEIAVARHADLLELKRLNAELTEALARVKKLEGIIPICSGCKKIRDDGGYWTAVEAYLTEHTDALFSHGVCPECVKRLYPEFAEEDGE